MSIELIMELGHRILNGGEITRDEALELSGVADAEVPFLLAMADRIRQKYCGNGVDLCAIVNGRSGMCSENCSFCAQSAYHQANIQVYPLMSEAELVAAAKQAEASGALRFAIVTSGRGMERDVEFPQIVSALKKMKEATNLSICCSLGTLSPENAKALKEAGVARYHHNVETSRSYYPDICTTHTYDDRIATVKAAQSAGLEVCSGGILGLGETAAQRVEMAFELKELNVECVPMNILNPIKGTQLEDQPGLPPREILKTIAIFRFVMPTKGLRTCGGREVNLRDLQSLALMSGIDGMMIGGYLTTSGRDCAADLRMVRDMGLKPLSAKEV